MHDIWNQQIPKTTKVVEPYLITLVSNRVRLGLTGSLEMEWLVTAFGAWFHLQVVVFSAVDSVCVCFFFWFP